MIVLIETNSKRSHMNMFFLTYYSQKTVKGGVMNSVKVKAGQVKKNGGSIYHSNY